MNTAGKGLVMMIHGLGGGEDTWGKFPQWLREDSEVSSRFDIAEPYTYTTNLAGKGPGIDQLAQELATHLSLPKFAGYQQIILFGHSMGGLVAKRLVADIAKAGQHLRIPQIITFSSPLLGAGGASLGKLAGGKQQQDLSIGSDFFCHLGQDWAALEVAQKVRVHHLVAGDDFWVSPWSSTDGFRSTGIVIDGEGHRSLTKPDSADAPVVQKVRELLLDTAPAWHRPPDPQDYRQPDLDTTLLSEGGRVNPVARFIYRARTVEFFGRDEEWKKLTAFLDAPSAFAWRVVVGAGGVGKSRLALELCLARSAEWYAGFVRSDALDHDWSHWQPLAPTLLVVDYATRDTEKTKKLLRALARRTLAGSQHPLLYPVRVLLLIRPADVETLGQDVLGVGSEAVAVEQCQFGGYLSLGEISDPWPIFIALFVQAGKPLPDREKTLAQFEKLDPQRRPLFAYFLADALISAPSPETVPHLDQERLIRDVLDRWQQNFWRPAYEQAGIGRGEREELLLALATMCNGIPLVDDDYPLPAMRENNKLLPEWDPHCHPAVFLAMTGQEARSTIPAFEPDIVGEHFVLHLLENCSSQWRQKLVDWAWVINPMGVAAFLDRLSVDVGERLLQNPVGQDLFALPREGSSAVLLVRSLLLVNLCARFACTGDKWLGELQKNTQTYPVEPSFREPWGKGVFNVLNASLRRQNLSEAGRLLAELRAAVEAYPTEAILRGSWAKGCVNVLTALSKQGVPGWDELLTELRSISVAYLEEPVLREAWAQGAFNVLSTLGDRKLFDAQKTLLADLRETSRAYPEEKTIRGLWAQGAFNALTALCQLYLPEARGLLSELQAVSVAYPAEEGIREAWAKGVVNLLAEPNLSDAQPLLEELRATSAAYPAEAELRASWARGAFNVLGGLCLMNFDEATKLLTELETAFMRYPEEVILKEAWTKGALVMLSTLHRQESMEGLERLAGLKAVIVRNSGEAGLHMMEELAAKLGMG